MMRPLALALLTLGLAACGGPASEKGPASEADSDAGVFSRANKRNAGYDAIKKSFDQFYARCGDSLVMKKTVVDPRNYAFATPKRTEFYQIENLDFAVIEAEVSPVDQKNGIEFAGLAVFSDAALYRRHVHEITRRGEEDQGWSDWETVGHVTESELDDARRYTEAWGYEGGQFERNNGVWDMEGVMSVPFVEIGELKDREITTTFEKPDCAEVPKE